MVAIYDDDVDFDDNNNYGRRVYNYDGGYDRW